MSWLKLRPENITDASSIAKIRPRPFFYFHSHFFFSPDQRAQKVPVGFERGNFLESGKTSVEETLAKGRREAKKGKKGGKGSLKCERLNSECHNISLGGSGGRMAFVYIAFQSTNSVSLTYKTSDQIT